MMQDLYNEAYDAGFNEGKKETIIMKNSNNIYKITLTVKLINNPKSYKRIITNVPKSLLSFQLDLLEELAMLIIEERGSGFTISYSPIIKE